MKPTQMTWYGVVGMSLVFLLTVAGTINGIVTQTWGLAISAGVFGLLLFLGLLDGIKGGIRQSDGFERFEAWITIRALVCFIGGGGGIALLFNSRFAEVPLSLMCMAVWLIVSLYFASRLRGRHEALPAYKRRVGYKDS